MFCASKPMSQRSNYPTWKNDQPSVRSHIEYQWSDSSCVIECYCPARLCWIERRVTSRQVFISSVICVGIIEIRGLYFVHGHLLG